MGTDTFAICLVAMKLPSPKNFQGGTGKIRKYRRTWKSQKQYEIRVHLLQHRAGVHLVKKGIFFLRLHWPRTIGHKLL